MHWHPNACCSPHIHNVATFFAMLFQRLLMACHDWQWSILLSLMFIERYKLPLVHQTPHQPPCATSLGCRNSKIAPDQYIWQTPLSSIDLEIPEEESAQVVLAKMMVDDESVLRRIAEADKSYKVPVSPV